MTHAIEPTGRDDEWEWQVVRLADGCVVGWFRTERTAQAYADNGGEPVLAAAAEPADDDQLDMFGRAA